MAGEGESPQATSFKTKLPTQRRDAGYLQRGLQAKVIALHDIVDLALDRKGEEFRVYHLGAQRLNAEAPIRVRQAKLAADLTKSRFFGHCIRAKQARSLDLEIPAHRDLLKRQQIADLTGDMDRGLFLRPDRGIYSGHGKQITAVSQCRLGSNGAKVRKAKADQLGDAFGAGGPYLQFDSEIFHRKAGYERQRADLTGGDPGQAFGTNSLDPDLGD